MKPAQPGGEKSERPIKSLVFGDRCVTHQQAWQIGETGVVRQLGPDRNVLVLGGIGLMLAGYVRKNINTEADWFGQPPPKGVSHKLIANIARTDTVADLVGLTNRQP